MLDIKLLQQAYNPTKWPLIQELTLQYSQRVNNVSQFCGFLALLDQTYDSVTETRNIQVHAHLPAARVVTAWRELAITI